MEPVDLRSGKNHYAQLLQQHGDSPKSLSWATEEVARRNFAAVTAVFMHETAPFTVYEVGCGLGHMSDFLEAHYPLARYSGCDIVPEMIESAKRRNASLNVELRDILDAPPPRSDYVVVSGLFNLRMENDPDSWWTFVRNMLRSMYAACDKGIGANFLTSYVDWKRDHGYYQDPCALFDFAQRELSRFSEIRHSYYPWEFTLFSYRFAKQLLFGPPPVAWPPQP